MLPKKSHTSLSWGRTYDVDIGSPKRTSSLSPTETSMEKYRLTASWTMLRSLLRLTSLVRSRASWWVGFFKSPFGCGLTKFIRLGPSRFKTKFFRYHWVNWSVAALGRTSACIKAFAGICIRSVKNLRIVCPVFRCSPNLGGGLKLIKTAICLIDVKVSKHQPIQNDRSDTYSPITAKTMDFPQGLTFARVIRAYKNCNRWACLKNQWSFPNCGRAF